MMKARLLLVVGALSAVPASTDLRAQQPIALRPPNAQLDVGMTMITSVRELSDGRLLVADRVENRLAIIDWRTNRITPIGGQGEGPGEFRRAGWLYPLRGDTSLFTEPTRRWHVLDADSIVRSFPLQREIQQTISPILSGTDAEDRALDFIGYSWSPTVAVRMGSYQADSLFVVIASGVTSDVFRLDTIARVAGRGLEGPCSPAGRAGPPGSAGAVRIPACNPIATAEQAVLFRDSWVAIAKKKPYRVDWRSPDGNWIRGASLDEPAVRMTDRDRCWASQSFPFRGPDGCDDRVIEARDWPEQLPAYGVIGGRAAAPMAPILMAASDGRLLIRRTPSVALQENRYDVIDRGGVRSGVITLPANEAIIGFGAGSIYTIRTDEVDLQWLRRHPWP